MESEFVLVENDNLYIDIKYENFKVTSKYIKLVLAFSSNKEKKEYFLDNCKILYESAVIISKKNKIKLSDILECLIKKTKPKGYYHYLHEYPKETIENIMEAINDNKDTKDTNDIALYINQIVSDLHSHQHLSYLYIIKVYIKNKEHGILLFDLLFNILKLNPELALLEQVTNKLSYLVEYSALVINPKLLYVTKNDVWLCLKHYCLFLLETFARNCYKNFKKNINLSKTLDPKTINAYLYDTHIKELIGIFCNFLSYVPLNNKTTYKELELFRYYPDLFLNYFLCNKSLLLNDKSIKEQCLDLCSGKDCPGPDLSSYKALFT